MTESVLLMVTTARNALSTNTIILQAGIAAKSVHVEPTRQPGVGHRKMYVAVDLVGLGPSQIKMAMGLVWLVQLASFSHKWGLTRAALVQSIPIPHLISVQQHPLRAAKSAHLRAFRIKALL